MLQANSLIKDESHSTPHLKLNPVENALCLRMKALDSVTAHHDVISYCCHHL